MATKLHKQLRLIAKIADERDFLKYCIRTKAVGEAMHRYFGGVGEYYDWHHDDMAERTKHEINKLEKELRSFNQ